MVNNSFSLGRLGENNTVVCIMARYEFCKCFRNELEI